MNMNRKSAFTFLEIMVSGVLILALASIVFLAYKPSSNKTTSSGDIYPKTAKVSKTIERAFEGSKTSKVQLTIFSDFQCPACQVVHELLWPRLTSEYIKTGKIGLTYKNFPLSQHQNAMGDALAGFCALDQGKWSEFSEKMYALEKQKNNADVTDSERIELIKSIGMDEIKFRTCYSEGWYLGEIDADMRAGEKLRLDHTPSIYLNGKIMNFKSEEEFFGIIEASLR